MKCKILTTNEMVVVNEAAKLQKIFKILIGDAAEEWENQKHQESFNSEYMWIEHLLDVHKHACKRIDCQINKCTDKCLADMDLSLKKRSPFRNNNNIDDCDPKESHTHYQLPHPTSISTATPKALPNPVIAHAGITHDVLTTALFNRAFSKDENFEAPLDLSEEKQNGPLDFTKDSKETRGIDDNFSNNPQQSKPVIASLLNKPPSSISSVSNSDTHRAEYFVNDLYNDKFPINGDQTTNRTSKLNLTSLFPHVLSSNQANIATTKRRGLLAVVSEVQYRNSQTLAKSQIANLYGRLSPGFSSDQSAGSNTNSPLSVPQKSLIDNGLPRTMSPLFTSRKSRRKNKHPTSIKVTTPNDVFDPDDDKDDDNENNVQRIQFPRESRDSTPCDRDTGTPLSIKEECKDLSDNEDMEEGYYRISPTGGKTEISEESIQDDSSLSDHDNLDVTKQGDVGGTVTCVLCSAEVTFSKYYSHLQSHNHRQWLEHMKDMSNKIPNIDMSLFLRQSPHLAIVDRVRKCIRPRSNPSNSKPKKKCRSNSSQESINSTKFEEDGAENVNDVDMKRLRSNMKSDITNETRFPEISVADGHTKSSSPSQNSAEKNFPCDLCAKRFSSKRLLTVHMKSHSDERPHACMVCGKSFKHSSHKRRHENQHFNKIDSSSIEDPSDAFIETVTVKPTSLVLQ